MRYRKPDPLCYQLARAVSSLFAAVVFRRKILRNEIRDAKGSFVVIANHQAALDYVNLIGLTRRAMTFVISSSFYQTLPITGLLRRLAVIPKQQFQTTVSDLKQMKAVIDAGQPLAIYPAGLMCEDGLSTPIPPATYKFLKWLNTDVYVAKTSGTYFAMPKWAGGLRPGRTYIDAYKLFSAEELAALSVDEIREKADTALSFDAYREQDVLRVRYLGGHKVEGLENVLYMCPCCRREGSIRVRDAHTLFCTECGYEQTSDEYAMLHNDKGMGPEFRYVSDWSRAIYAAQAEKLRLGQEQTLSAATAIHMIDPNKHKFVEAGQGTVTLNQNEFVLEGHLNGKPTTLFLPILNFPTLPFCPGKYLEIQDGSTIYRCVLRDGRLVMKFINLIKIFHEGRQSAAPPPSLR